MIVGVGGEWGIGNGEWLYLFKEILNYPLKKDGRSK
jgi:hypothetical protein